MPRSADEEVPGLRDLGGTSDVLPRAREDPLALEAHDSRVGVPVGREGVAALEILREGGRRQLRVHGGMLSLPLPAEPDWQ